MHHVTAIIATSVKYCIPSLIMNYLFSFGFSSYTHSLFYYALSHTLIFASTALWHWDGRQTSHTLIEMHMKLFIKLGFDGWCSCLSHFSFYSVQKQQQHGGQQITCLFDYIGYCRWQFSDIFLSSETLSLSKQSLSVKRQRKGIDGWFRHWKNKKE